ncbi:MAG: exodeoxyribonuclease VII large subunit [Actinomycetaceae bacterium]|nr:exodeoxyribonuclease VII large subunit [Actinomycetaceae bacterium]
MNEQPQPPKPLARLARETTQDNPWPLRLLAQNLEAYIGRLDPLWIEAQVVQYNQRPGTRMSFLTVRDLQADASMDMTAFSNVIAGAPGLQAGARVVAQVHPNFWVRSGRFNLEARQIHLVGTGDLLAQIEQLRARLQAEGLFDAGRKRPLPFLPGCIGLICGRNAKAKDDVLVNATARWPGANFEIREVEVQGQRAVGAVTNALAQLDALAHVDVIVIARGGGSVEDLLPFSDERLVRAAAATRTPVVSAIGHEGDAPLLDFVADLRASTPTDAARKVVPDLQQEKEGLAQARAALRQRVQHRLNLERERLELITARPVLASPAASLQSHRAGLEQARQTLRHRFAAHLGDQRQQLTQARAALRAMSPQATLERGYSIIKAPGVGVVTDVEQVSKGNILEATLARGSMIVTVFGTSGAAEKTVSNEDQ